MSNIVSLRVTDLNALSGLTGLSVTEINRLVGSIPEHYTKISLPRCNGNQRFIEASTGALRQVQKWIHTNILSIAKYDGMPFTPQQQDKYRRASYSRLLNFVFTVDLERFYAGITAKRVRAIYRQLGFSEELVNTFTELTTLNGRLPQGAPTSLTLANLVCRGLDAKMEAMADAHGWRYTRYLDRITLSGFGHFRAQQYNILSTIKDEGFVVNQRSMRLSYRSTRSVSTEFSVNAMNVPDSGTTKSPRRRVISRHRTACQLKLASVTPRQHLRSLALVE